MAKFKAYIHETIIQEHTIIIEADNEDEVSDVLDYADSCKNNTADDYIESIKRKLNVTEYCKNISEKPDEVECYDYNEIEEEK